MLSYFIILQKTCSVLTYDNFQTNGIFKISSYGNLITKFMCLISARNNNIPRIVSVKVLILPVAAEPTLHAIKHL